MALAWIHSTGGLVSNLYCGFEHHVNSQECYNVALGLIAYVYRFAACQMVKRVAPQTPEQREAYEAVSYTHLTLPTTERV